MEIVVGDKELIEAFCNADFGNNELENKKKILLKSLRAFATGFWSGKTITHIMLKLNLITCNNNYVDNEGDVLEIYHLTNRGLNYLLTSSKPPEQENSNCCSFETLEKVKEKKREFMDFTMNMYVNRDTYSRGKIVEDIRDKALELLTPSKN